MNNRILLKMVLAVISAIPLSKVFAQGKQNIDSTVMSVVYNEVKTPYKYGVVITPDSSEYMVDCPTVFREGNKWLMTYVQYDGRGYETYLAESDDLLHWVKKGKIMSLPNVTSSVGNEKNQKVWDLHQRGGFPSLLDLKWGNNTIHKYKGKYWMTYIGSSTPGYEGVPISIGLASTKDNIGDVHEWMPTGNPIMTLQDPDAKAWESHSPYKSMVYKLDALGSRFVMFYNAAQSFNRRDVREKIGIALSDDLIHWKRYKGNPVFFHNYPRTITGDAQIVEMKVPSSVSGKTEKYYVMFYYCAHNPEYPYGAYNNFAVSKDLIHWTDWKGPVLVSPSESYDSRYAHKSYVVKWNDTVYHFYCAVDKDRKRTIAVSTSKDFGTESESSKNVAKSHDKVSNPILPGFNPDPSICAVDSDYYLITSSFEYVPGLPIYHSRDLINWELISHAIDRNNIDKFHFEGINDNDGVWAPTIRYHDGTFYITCTMWRSGGNFVLTAKDPRGPWSAPVWVKTPGIDPTLFWDTDGRSYYVGNRYDFKHEWSGQVGIFVQEIDLGRTEIGTLTEKKTGLTFEAPTYPLVGKNKIVTFGHATNAAYAEGPHIYKMGDTYYLLMAEGGSGSYHAVTVHTSKNIMGPYRPQQINPVLSHRQMGFGYPIQNIGHADIFHAADGKMYAVCLGNRTLKDEDGKRYSPLGRETFLTNVEMQGGQLIFAPGVGYVDTEFTRPNLPWTPVAKQKEPWYGLRGFPQNCTMGELPLSPLVIDSLCTPSCMLQKLHGFKWTFSRNVTFSTKKTNEWAGVTLYRTADSYYTLMKGKDCIRLTRREKGKSIVVGELPYKEKNVRLTIDADSMQIRFLVNGQQIAHTQSMRPLCDDGKYNKFNGLGVGIYATSEGKKTKAVAKYEES